MREHKVRSEVGLEVKDWTVHHPLYHEKVVDNHISFKVHKGEVIGFSGLQGAGRTELAMSIFGKSYGTNISGELYLNGTKVDLKNPEQAIRHKLAYVTEGRATAWRANQDYKQELEEANYKLYRLNKEQKKLEGIISQIPPELLAQLTKTERDARKNQERGKNR